MNDEREYTGEVMEVRSGDDLLVLINLNMDGLFKKTRVRLKGVDVPSAFCMSGNTEPGRIRDELKALVKGASCRLLVHNYGKNNSGWLATLFVKPYGQDIEININQMFIDKGYVFVPKTLVQRENEIRVAENEKNVIISESANV